MRNTLFCGPQCTFLNLKTTLLYPVFGDVQLLVNIGGYLGLFIGLSLNDLLGCSLDFIVAAVSRRRKKLKN